MKPRVPKRYVVVILIILMAKMAGGLLLYYNLNFSSATPFWGDSTRAPQWPQNLVLKDNPDQNSKWPYLFLGWDSAWYLSIAEKGYSFSNQSYTFFPALPFLTSVLTILIGDPLSSISILAFVFGIAWVPLFQLIAEKYMGRRAAMASTFLMAFSPFIFLFTTVAYSEGLFLFFTLGAWLLFLKGRISYAAILSTLATLTRPAGFLFSVPLIIGALRGQKEHRTRNALVSNLPLVAYGIWWAYCGFASNDWLAPIHTTEWSQMYTLRFLILDIIPQNGLQAISTGITDQNWLAVCFIWAIIVAVPFLVYQVLKRDKPLGIYSLLYYVGVLTFGAIASIPRFLSFIFPAWLAPQFSKLCGKRIYLVLLIFVIACFYLIGLYLWAAFLNGEFVA